MRVIAVIALLAVSAASLSCGGGVDADVSRAELAAIVEADSLSFDGTNVPSQLSEQLAPNQVIVLGETHHLREHWAFVAELLRALHGSGVRQLLIESPQMADWLFDDYVTGGGLEPTYELPAFYSRQLEAIRSFNETLPPDERIHVRLIDVNEEHHGGAEAFRGLLALTMQHVDQYAPASTFLDTDFADEDAERDAIEILQSALEDDRDMLITMWGADWYARVVEMISVERSSIDVRSFRETDDEEAVRQREAVIKGLVDDRLTDYPHRTVINIGSTHAQKSYLRGTEIEWLGDYLVHRSPAVTGGIIVIDIVAARIELEPGATGTEFDVIDSSPDYELFRTMAETFPGKTVYLPLEATLFRDQTVAVNYEETIFVATLGDQYDAVLLYGSAHRMPSD